jgi:MoxR-like ATPase
MKIERLSVESFYPRGDCTYEDVVPLHPLFDKLAFKSNLILVGPKGIAKTLSFAAWAAKQHTDPNPCPIITFDCSEDVRRHHLLGSFYLSGSDSPFVLGPLPTAIEVANEVGRCILQLEEINGLLPQMQKLLNPITDWRRKIELPEAKKVFRLNDNAQLWITGTMNITTYSGVFSLNEDLKSRLRLLPLDYPTPAKTKQIIRSVLSYKAASSRISKILQLAVETRTTSFEYALSTRDVIQFLEDSELVGVKDALWLLRGKFEGEERETFKIRANSIFGKNA